MAVLSSSPWARIGFLLLAVYFSKQVAAVYDPTLCAQHATKDKVFSTTPYFYDDFSALTEETIYEKDGNTNGRIVHQKIRYSTTQKRMDIEETRLKSALYYYVDEKLNTCTFDDYDISECEQEEGTCLKIQPQIGFFKFTNDKVSLSTTGQKLWWPIGDANTEIKKKANMGDSEVRSIKTKKYITCAYDRTADTTIVTEWHVLDVDKYTSMDQTKEIVLMAHHHRAKDQDAITSRRIDYFDYRKMPADARVQINEDKCWRNDPRPIKTPNFPPRFSYLREVDSLATDGTFSFTRYLQKMEYNAMSQVVKVTSYHDRNDEKETDVSFRYTDYSTKHQYMDSVTQGNCTVVPGDKIRDENLPSPKGIWKMENIRSRMYEPTAVIRDIPCVAYHSPDRMTPHRSNHLFLASSDWLKDQGRDETEFYPVQFETNSVATSYRKMSIYQYSTNPGYHYPDLVSCFDGDDTKYFDFVLLVDYDSNVKDKLVKYRYEMRTFIKKITGIVASVRIPFIYFYKRNQVGETVVSVTIFGDARKIDRSNKAYYDSDPVTSQEAADKIKKAVDTGSETFEFEKEKTTIKIKKGSFRSNRARPGKPGASPRHSSGAMAGVGIAMTLVGLALGVGLVFGYKQWRQGSLPALSFTFGKDGIKGAV